MINYEMRFQESANWDTAKVKFQDFLHRKLNIDRSSIIIEGIVSTSDTWYTMKGTPALLKALNQMLNNARNDAQEEPENNIKKLMVCLVAVIAVGLFLMRR